MAREKKLKLSVLDQSPIRNGSNAVEALQESIQLVQLADRLGYTRYWVSEHHNTATLAGSAPEILIARLAAASERIRVGSGGVMLPNHSTLKVAENFRLLEALFPHRIDLGIGRAPGGDRMTAHLLNPSNTFNPREFVQQIADLQAYLSEQANTGSVHEKVKAIPHIDTMPHLWMLTSSGESGLLAAHYGMALSFAHFIYPVGGPKALQAYREQFRPSPWLQAPLASVGIFVFCADTEKKAQQLQTVMDHRLLNLEKGRLDVLPAYDEIKDYEYSPAEWERVLHNRGRMITGTPPQVKAQLLQLAADYEVDEIVIATITDHFDDRLRSYELLAETML
ncbi:MAG TPA: LLM class flavin-dependent oxidoreductase [Chitinophaga sp.]|uniref:LLM class flavin-dependent oxidoreductase n=1 Tax=Chitinophaga sp. TaxID=1869181 RepID=UPI002DBF99B6|nr:LLM class flavin-dependent oxidoreductase [Chitinophaga sp.]HEU4555721.1 LLM class flavin-dependent oxidoreductase [Chitinophaga sp.]